MRRLTEILLLTTLLLTACSAEPEPSATPESAPPEAQAPETKPPETDAEDVNWTKKASEAWRTVASPGWLVLRVREARTGKPVTDCGYYAVRFGFTKRAAAGRISMMISPSSRPHSEDGNYRFKLAAGWHQLRLEAPPYRKTWTPVFQIEEGKETALSVEMKLSNRLRVTVIDADGSPLKEGAVSLDGEKYKRGLHVENGVGECLVPVDEITVSVGTVFLEEYERQSVTVSLKQGVVNEVTIRLEK